MTKIVTLGIESSCDDTSVAVFIDNEVQTNLTASQKIHNDYGGVVPELASRAHQANILPTLDQALEKAQLSIEHIDLIAFTKGPGLLGSLHVGTSFAKGLALALNKPLIGIDHMQGHILAHFIKEPNQELRAPSFPFLCLTVSGGHTQIVHVKDYFDTKIIGSTRDDAAGEAFDKIAKMLKLGYPGGPLIDKMAKKGNPLAFDFPITNLDEYAFSFSGIKTAVMYFLDKQPKGFIEQHMADICASAQHAICKMLLLKIKKAAKDYNIKDIALAGGVSANSYLRVLVDQWAHQKNLRTYYPKIQYCTDNGAMIAIAGYLKYLQGHQDDLSVTAKARLY